MMPRRPAIEPTFALAMSHITHDMYLPFLVALMPLLVPKHNLTMVQAAWLVASYNIARGLLQPAAGFLADRTGSLAFTALAAPITGLAMSSIGYWPLASAVALAAGIGGLSSSLFHPQGMSLASMLGGNRRDLAMGIFSSTGSLGIALGPVFLLSVVNAYGMEKSYLAAIPPLVLLPLFIRFVPWRTRLPYRGEGAAVLRSVSSNWRPVLVIILITALRTWVMTSFQSFLGVYLVNTRGIPIGTVKWALSLFLLAEGIGCFLGGYLSGRLGRRAVISASLPLAIVPLMMVPRIQGVGLWPLLLVSSVILNLSGPILIVMAQEVMPQAVATASALIGGSEAAGSLLVVLIGAIADRAGLLTALTVSALSLIVPFCLSLTIRNREQQHLPVN